MNEAEAGRTRGTYEGLSGAGPGSAGLSGEGLGSGPEDDPFLRNRRLLFSTAYHMLGSVADAEDVLQDAWLRWARADRADVRHPTAYLVRTVSRLCLNRLTSARATRETYIGPWLPEPLLTGPDVGDRADTAHSVSMAMLVVLETLSPLERAVFVLREVFGYEYAEIAEAVERAEPAVRQTAHRARAHIQARRSRYDADDATRAAVTERFLAACAGGDLNAVLELLAPDVTAWSDGGGKVTAATRPLRRADHVARWVLGVLGKPELAALTAGPATINGRPGILFALDGLPIGALTLELAADGRIHELRIQANPDKLRGLAR